MDFHQLAIDHAGHTGYTSGLISGLVIDKLHSNHGDYDYDFITKFSAVLPKYLEDFTQHLKEYSSGIIDKESKYNKEKLQELQNAAFQILASLDDLKHNGFFYPVKLLNYIRIIRNVITLSMSIIEEIGNVSESSQDFIRKYLGIIKYSMLPTLFGLTDKIEDNAMLSPGTLSLPLMKAIKPIYEWLISYASKPVDFMAKGEELLRIEDPRFIEQRLELTYKRIAEIKKKTFKIHRAEDAIAEFYAILSSSECANRSIHQLPFDVRQTLMQHYKLIRPYMAQIDIDLNNLLIDTLNAPSSSSESWGQYVYHKVTSVVGKYPPDHSSFIFAKKEALDKLVAKDKTSQDFHIKLNTDIITSVYKNAELAIFPYQGEDFFAIDEQQLLTSWKADKDHLKYENLLDLAELYFDKSSKLMAAKTAFGDFLDLIKTAKERSPDAKSLTEHLLALNDIELASCRNLYNVIQPIFCFGSSEKTNAQEIDTCLSHFFANKPYHKTLVASNLFEKLAPEYVTKFTKAIKNWDDRRNDLIAQAKKIYLEQTKNAALEKEKNFAERTHHVLRHTYFSHYAKEFKDALFNFTRYLNKPMRKELIPKAEGLPYPEIEEQNSTLVQPQQVLAIKRIFNSLHHIEGIALELEKLTHKQLQSTYVYHLLVGYGHIKNIVDAVQALAVDPQYKPMAIELWNLALKVQNEFDKNIEPYTKTAESVDDDGPVKNNAIWYVLNAFYLIPKHIRTLRNNSFTTDEELEELQHQAKLSTQRVEAIIDSSSSYFRLFLQTPNMYRLYNSFVEKLNEFTNTAHDAAINNLHRIQTDVFIPMLQLADYSEAQAGIEPGSLSGPLRKITNEYLKGLLNPLGLSSKAHIGMVNDLSPIKKRQEVIRGLIAKAKEPLEELQKNQELFGSMLYNIKVYSEIKYQENPEDEDELHTVQKDLADQYYQARPLLVQIASNFIIEPNNDDANLELDKLFNDSALPYYSPRENIRAQVVAAGNYYIGRVASKQLEVKSLEGQLAYLQDLENQQMKDNAEFIESYTQNVINKQITSLSSRHVGLQYLNDEYSNELKAYLTQYSEAVLHEAKESQDIKQTVNQILKEKIPTFEKEHFEKFYHLDSIRAQFANFKIYFTEANHKIGKKSSYFENDNTIQKKTALIKQLDTLADTGFLSIEEHIARIKPNSPDAIQLIKSLKDLNAGKSTIPDLINELKHSKKEKEENSAKIAHLIQLGNKVKLNLDERVDYLQTRVKSVEFRSTILAYHQPDTFTFAFLWRCILALLEVLHLYTPKPKQLYNEINDTMDNPPRIGELTNRFGLFATTDAPDQRENVEPVFPNTAVAV